MYDAVKNVLAKRVTTPAQSVQAILEESKVDRGDLVTIALSAGEDRLIERTNQLNARSKALRKQMSERVAEIDKYTERVGADVDVVADKMLAAKMVALGYAKKLFIKTTAVVDVVAGQWDVTVTVCEDKDSTYSRFGLARETKIKFDKKMKDFLDLQNADAKEQADIQVELLKVKQEFDSLPRLERRVRAELAKSEIARQKGGAELIEKISGIRLALPDIK